MIRKYWEIDLFDFQKDVHFHSVRQSTTSIIHLFWSARDLGFFDFLFCWRVISPRTHSTELIDQTSNRYYQECTVFTRFETRCQREWNRRFKNYHWSNRDARRLDKHMYSDWSFLGEIQNSILINQNILVLSDLSVNWIFSKYKYPVCFFSKSRKDSVLVDLEEYNLIFRNLNTTKYRKIID